MSGGAVLVQVLFASGEEDGSQHVACQHLLVVACGAFPASGVVASDVDPGAGCETFGGCR